jgi:hypothetical protein
MQKLVNAVDLALAGQWDRAHQTVQGIEDEMAYWIHAVLHKMEGDQENSKYWYSRAGKTKNFPLDAAEELQTIRRALLDEKK